MPLRKLADQGADDAGVETRVSFTAKEWVAGSIIDRQLMGRLYLDGVREDFEAIAPAFERRSGGVAKGDRSAATRPIHGAVHSSGRTLPSPNSMAS